MEQAASIIKQSPGLQLFEDMHTYRHIDVRFEVFTAVTMKNGVTSKKTLFFIGIQFVGVGCNWAHLVHTPLAGLVFQHHLADEDKCRAVGGMRTLREKRRFCRKSTAVPPVQHKSAMT
jgi:hypothetical protein